MLIVTRSVTPKKPSEIAERSIPPDLERLVMESLEKSPDDRPESADEMHRRLGEMRSAAEWSEELAERWWSEHRAAG